MARPMATKVRLTYDELQPLRNIFRLGVALGNDKSRLADVLENGEASLPLLSKESYDTFSQREWKIGRRFADRMFTGKQSRGDRKCPSFSTYYRCTSPANEEGITFETLKDFLFIAQVILHRVAPDAVLISGLREVGIVLNEGTFSLAAIEAKLAKAEQDAAHCAPTKVVTSKQIRQALSERAEREAEQIGEIDKLFVPLSLISDRNEKLGAQQAIQYSYLNILDLLRDTSAFPILILLGEPGAGKSTILRNLEAGLLSARPANPLLAPLFVQLSNYQQNTNLTPAEWLEILWTRAYGYDQITFHDALANGRVLLILDGFNELGGQELMERWSQFVRSQVAQVPNNRVVLSCRKFDYTVPIALDGLYVPHARVAPMNPDTIRRFLEKSQSNLFGDLWAAIENDPSSLSFFGVPLFLRILVDTVDDPDAMTLSPSTLFTRLVWRLVRREMARRPSLFGDPLFTSIDRARISMSYSFSKVASLPDEGRLIPFLTDLASLMMPDRVGMSLTEVRGLMENYSPNVIEAALKAGCAISIIGIDLEELSVTFGHQLFQEFFAARKIAKEFSDDLWTLRWKVGEVEPFRPVSLHEQLPSLPSSGWEEATIMAACLAQNQEDFVARVFNKNPLLGARCAASTDTKVSNELYDSIQSSLHQLLRDSSADMRARLQAGLLIRDLRVLGYEDKGSHLLPPMVRLGGEIYEIGSDPFDSSGIKFHANQLTLPKQECLLETYFASAYHVTNAEYGRFIEAGGYDEVAWWQGAEANLWRTGESLYGDLQWQLEYDIETHLRWGEDYIKAQVGLRWSQREAGRMLRQLKWTADQRSEWLRSEVEKIGRPTVPSHWWDSEYNMRTQPVVGVSWFEAQAYCRWLSSVSSESYRLLSEYEFEVAARGKDGRAYAFGPDCDITKCNIFPSRIWKPSPVGLYENGQPIYDLTGNVWTWTSSTDGEIDAQRKRMAVRGGSYDTSPVLAQSFCRDSNHPGYRDRFIGFRLAKDAE